MLTKLTQLRKIRKQHKEEAKADEEATVEEEQEVPVPFATHGNNILHSIFPILKCASTFSKNTTLMDCMRSSVTFPTTSSGPSLNTTEFCTAKGTTMKNILMKI